MNTNYLNILLIYLLVPNVLARGPHHPRGAKVVKRHVHYTPGKKIEKLTQDLELLQDKEHLKEHLEEEAPKIDLSKLTEAEIELYYFLLHDSDKNSKLDGLELLNAVLHTTHDDDYEESIEEDNNGNSKSENSEDAFSNFVGLVDQVLKEDDRNQDGYLDYAEYVEGRKKADQGLDERPNLKIT
ncbi:multiple coagulation factor deficiency protein 2 homolog [Anthonomus grandis grandis]|uniref:multiple coagulation factor deficiency protein 2 homolog n=1 Tax=Anthonomus grandis grandis TaxID=2921223 RepID=UPI0021653779|nr:multiple coagulation factor deficiency protein 2 homolog [Anthonomus grandis grandis]XP_050298686.1 multiple coagulation factor deficiency protein 2 homolog [Anthonomus grandis grandis]XP_050298687.1 multiple coagulation factor deficiency protein 2 homolog [Anthonomus grandis grandis]XP_050298688.1 multiple coagulation factor deficiency protein 2 homolog [Anthonomus grandis grandis]XP_050298690.1 multiple coagulation factor deficiency protein 2 homolog [Anthonomus grandis grandis]XP_0502986